MPEGPDGKTIIVVKRPPVSRAHYGGAWKVAYADFVTAMMGLFMVLWLVNSATVQKRERIARYFRQPGVFEIGSGNPIDGGERVTVINEPTKVTSAYLEQEGKNLLTIATELEEVLKKLTEAKPSVLGRAELSLNDQGIRIDLMDTASVSMFESGSSKLNAQASAELGRLSAVLKKFSNPIEIEGHTDASLFANNFQYDNWTLSTDRANAARRFLLEQGIDQKRIAKITGYADQHLKIEENPESPLNRRISLVIQFDPQVMRALQENLPTATQDKPSNELPIWLQKDKIFGDINPFETGAK